MDGGVLRHGIIPFSGTYGNIKGILIPYISMKPTLYTGRYSPPFFIGDTSVIFRYGRNFSRPTVYYLFNNVGNVPVVSSYFQLDSLRASFIPSIAFIQLSSVTCSVPPVVPA